MGEGKREGSCERISFFYYIYIEYGVIYDVLEIDNKFVFDRYGYR